MKNPSADVDPQEEMETEASARQKRVIEWLNNSFQNNANSVSKSSKISKISKPAELPYPPCSPHYDVDSSSSSVQLETPFDPHDLSQRLESCPICYTRYESPKETFNCIKNHGKHLCLFCFQLLDPDRLTVTRHFRKERHFCDTSELAVKCPFPDCSTPDRKYSFVLQIQKHIFDQHLPQTYPKSRRNVAGKVVSDLSVLRPSVKLEKTDSETEEDHKRAVKLKNCSVVSEGMVREKVDEDRKNGKNNVIDYQRRGSRFEDIDNELSSMSMSSTSASDKSVSTSEEDPAQLSKFLSDVVKEESGSPRRSPFYVCSFCGRIFVYRKGLLNHNVLRKCDNLQDKHCSGCGRKFAGYSILEAILHLLNCHRSHRVESRDRPIPSQRDRRQKSGMEF